jgi:hypothetical protein
MPDITIAKLRLEIEKVTGLSTTEYIITRRDRSEKRADNDRVFNRSAASGVCCTQLWLHYEPNRRVRESQNLFVKTLMGRTLTFQTDASDTVNNLKRQIEDKEWISPDQQKLIHQGRQLDDDRMLSDFDIKDVRLHFDFGRITC